MDISTDNESCATARPAGRPRSEGCRQKILHAANALLGEDGFDRISVDAIAQSAGVSKATIYRWWPNKAAVLMDALLASTEADVYVPTSAFPEEDLIARIRRTIALFRGPRAGTLRSLIGQAQFDPELADAYRRQLLGPRRAALRGAMERCIVAGVLRPDFDIDLAIDLIYGPLYERLLLGHAPIDEAFERDYPPVALAALRGYAAPSRKG